LIEYDCYFLDPFSRFVALNYDIVATKEMRTALFFYVIAMHLLVFVTTYHWSHAGGCHVMDNDHLSHLPPVIPEHIQQEMRAKAAGMVPNAAEAVNASPGG